tara:strand:+ start:365 stop:796 length:432 start_codon:yes stop_codon:yes gene_type:complete
VKLTRKKLRNLILKEYLNTAGNSGYRFIGGGGGSSGDDPGDGGGGRFTPCENFDSKKHKNSLEIIYEIFQQAYEIRGDWYAFLKESGFFSENQLFSIHKDAEVYLMPDLATELCKAGNNLAKRMEILFELTNPKTLFMMLNNY